MKKTLRKVVLSVVAIISLSLVGLGIAEVAGGGIFWSPKNNVEKAATPTDNWADYAATSYAGGSGTQGDPYQISCAEELALMAKDINSGNNIYGYFELIDDIFLGEHCWTSIGGYYHYTFNGEFDGNNHTIYGMQIKYGNGDLPPQYVAFFGYASGYIHDFTLSGGFVDLSENPNQDTYKQAASVLGGGNGSLTNVHSSVDVIGGDSVGGLMCISSSKSIIKNCSYTGTISGKKYIGGIIGRYETNVYEPFIQNCTVSATINGTETVGGIVGYLADWYASDGICDCKFSGKVSGTNKVGGIVGETAGNGGNIQRSIVDATISGTQDVGGLVGYSRSVVANNNIIYGFIDGDSLSGAFVGSMIPGTFTLNNNVFIGSSTDDSISFTAKGSQKVDFATICSYAIINKHKYFSTGVTGADLNTWAQNWAIVPGLNDGKPVQRSLYWSASAAPTGTETTTALAKFFEDFEAGSVWMQ